MAIALAVAAPQSTVQAVPPESDADLLVFIELEQDVLFAGRVLPIVVSFENRSAQPVLVDPFWYLRGKGHSTRIGASTEFFPFQPVLRIVRPDGTEVVTSRALGAPTWDPYFGPPGSERVFVKLDAGAVFKTEFNLWVALEDGPEILFNQDGEYSIAVAVQNETEPLGNWHEVQVRVEQPRSELEKQHLDLIRSMSEPCRYDLFIAGVDQNVLCRDADQVAIIQRLVNSPERSAYQDYARYWQLRRRYAELRVRTLLLELGHEQEAGDDLKVHFTDLLSELRAFLSDIKADELERPCRQLIERVVQSKARLGKLRSQ